METKETFDIINEKDKVIGTASREECHNNPNIIHRGVHFTLYNMNSKEILFSKLPARKKRDQGMNVFLGEHVKSGETYVDALVRGVEEKLGFVPVNFKEFGIKIFEEEDEKERAKFFLVYVDKEKVIFDNNEIEGEWWLDVEKLKDFNDNVGPITKYWIDNVDWNKAL